jgi:putative proteasome-type protease
MTYCVGIKLNAGLVFLTDSRTNAGVDHISTFRKMIVYERPGDRFMVLLTAGNLSISQSVREILQVEQLKEREEGEAVTIWGMPTACSMRPACLATPCGTSTTGMPMR